MLRLLFFLMLDSFFCKLFSAFLLPLSRIWAARAHGASVPALTSWTSWDATKHGLWLDDSEVYILD